MAWKTQSLAWMVEHLSPFIPAAIGSAVAQAWEPGLGWRQRLVQWSVGVFVSHYATATAAHVLGWSEPVANGVGFIVGMLAFKSVQPMADAMRGGVMGAFGRLPGIVESWLRRPGAPPTPPSQGDAP